uniref:G-protein coupled receptors family 1 profile domain-containing protein n=1 Tax=Romanomermis culicivorax TaxID=13658 RepID=A0A915L0X7_ROMCU
MLVNILLTMFLYVVPLFVLITFNCMLTVFLKRTRQRTSALRSQANMLQPNYEPENVNGRQNANSRPNSASQRPHNSRTSARHNRTTALLIAMAVSYGVLWFPFIVLTLYLHMGPGKSMSAQRSMKFIDETCKMISMSSICVNPFLYGYLNTNFNREFKFIINALSMNLLFKWNFQIGVARPPPTQ